jgi:hypothetical protein
MSLLLWDSMEAPRESRHSADINSNEALRKYFYAWGPQAATQVVYSIRTCVVPPADVNGEIHYARWQAPKGTPRKELFPNGDRCAAGFLREGDAAIDVGAHTGDTAHAPCALAVWSERKRGCDFGTPTLIALSSEVHGWSKLEHLSNNKPTSSSPLMFRRSLRGWIT